MRGSWLSVLIVGLAVSCGSATTVTSGPDEIETLRVGCPNGPFFPITALDSAPPLLEDSSVPEVAAAIAPFLESGEGDFWPQDGWRVLEVIEGELTSLVHPGSEDQPSVSFMSASWDSGAWRWSGSSIPGDCVLVVEPSPDDGVVVEWVLDPAAGPPGPEATTLMLLATERGCASGQPMGDRMNDPVVTLTAEAVLIHLTTEPRTGDQNCPGNPSQAVQIELPEPLGARAIRDARSTDLGDLQTLLGDLIAAR